MLLWLCYDYVVVCGSVCACPAAGGRRKATGGRSPMTPSMQAMQQRMAGQAPAQSSGQGGLSAAFAGTGSGASGGNAARGQGNQPLIRKNSI